jgi:outer membrane protein OmpA-like peptidoglycan-associated protein
MKHLFSIFLLMAGMFFTTSEAQNLSSPAKSDYSRWSIGANVGMPFYWGDFKSFSADKTYYGINGGLQLTYQISSLLGITFSGDYGQNKAGSREYSKNYLLDQTGYTYYVSQTKTTAAYSSLYSKISELSFGLGVDVNLLRLLTSNPNRRFAILLTPTAWVQKYSTDVYKKSDDSKYTDGTMKQNWHFALGGSLALRYRASKNIDLQLKNTFAYIYNNKFDGIETYPSTRQNYMWMPQLGIVFKLGNTAKSGKVDNMLYYGKSAVQPAPVVEPQAEPVKQDTVVQQQPAPQKEVVQPEKVVLPTLPSLYFDFNRWNIDTERQASDLKTIVDALRQYADYPVVIEGYADKKGSEANNRIVSQRRADALKKYLVGQGVDENRITTEGCGEDTAVSDAEARRVEVILQSK